MSGRSRGASAPPGFIRVPRSFPIHENRPVPLDVRSSVARRKTIMTARSLTSVLVVSVLVAAAASSSRAARRSRYRRRPGRGACATLLRPGADHQDALLSDVLREAAPALRALGWPCDVHEARQDVLEYDAPNGKRLVSDGTRIRLYEPGAPGEPEQSSRPRSPTASCRRLSFSPGKADWRSSTRSPRRSAHARLRCTRWSRLGAPAPHEPELRAPLRDQQRPREACAHHRARRPRNRFDSEMRCSR